MCHQARPAATEGHAALSLEYLQYWGCSHMRGHVQNVGLHLAATSDGHETSQINTKQFTLSPSTIVSRVYTIFALYWSGRVTKFADPNTQQKTRLDAVVVMRVYSISAGRTSH